VVVQGSVKEVHVLDGKVLQNVGIALAKYKMTPPDLVRAILQMDNKIFGTWDTNILAYFQTPT
jgi:hypothetical protein